MQYLEGENRFYVPGAQGEADIAEITYRLEDNVAYIVHTYVDPNFRGQGIAEHLFRLVVDKLQQNGHKIVPLCSYAVKQFERHPELQQPEQSQ